jgi:RNA polymerase sigma-70 factor, ECF subfamily
MGVVIVTTTPLAEPQSVSPEFPVGRRDVKAIRSLAGEFALCRKLGWRGARPPKHRLLSVLCLILRLSRRLILAKAQFHLRRRSMKALDVSADAEFLPLFIANETQIRAFVRTLVRDPRDVDDVFQAVALILWRKFDQYDSTRPFGPWARGIAAKEVLAMRRGNARCPTPFPPEVVVAILDQFEHFLQSRESVSETTEALDKCVEALPPNSQKMLQLRYGEAMQIRDVASRLGQTVGATQRALSRIHKRLAECIETRLAAVKGGESS